VLLAVLVLEMTSWDLLHARDQAARNHQLVTTFEDDMERAFGGGRLQASERVLFLPAENDYLIGGIAPPRRLFTYNLAFDKEMARVRPLQPTAVLDAITAYSTGTLGRAHLCELFRQDLVDAVVFTDFDMRRDTLIWPPSHDRIEARRARNEALGLLDDPAFTVDDGHLSTILRAAPASPGGC
jgi:hypothetical protein